MIEHEGIIEKISGSLVTVRILQQSACNACHARGTCMAAGAKEKQVEVTDSSGRFRENERVIIEGKESIGYKAVFRAFVLPLIILLLTLILTLSLLHVDETTAAISAVTALIPYFLLLYLLRKKMANSFQFTIKKVEG
ncbi:MAG: SoxR reducing system RseC family protein [Proteiniphilum sp.]|jgi:sigma-E factor negative regulatory protein RseC|nr:SoxR reducing system RseC family protein [Proteiniphilum sp.]